MDETGCFALHGENVERLRCGPELRTALSGYAVQVTNALGNDAIGVYVHGSLGRGCYHPATSDVDVFVVAENPRPDDAIPQILAAHERSAAAIDATFVTRAQLDSDRAPTPVDFVVKPLNGGRVFRLPEGHQELLLQRQEVYDCDLALIGPSAREIVRPVPWEALADCLEHLLPQILPHFKNPALMLCRIACAFAQRSLCSKRDAGEWALDALDQKWRPLIGTALAKYAAGIPDDRGPDDELRAFEAYCAEYLVRVCETR